MTRDRGMVWVNEPVLVVAAWVFGLAACTRVAPSDASVPPPTVEAVRAPAPTVPSRESAPWQRLRLEAHGLSAELVEGTDAVSGAAFVVQRRGETTASLRAGSGATFAAWRASQGAGAVFAEERDDAACGRPAHRGEVTVPRETATGLVPDPNGGVAGHIRHEAPARVEVVLAGTTPRGTPFVATWRVSAQERDAQRADEARFFRSVRCDAR